MPSYRVHVPFSAFYVYDVEAENEEQAEELALSGQEDCIDQVSEVIDTLGVEVEKI